MWIECVKSLCDEGYQLLFILDGLPAYQLEWLLETTGTVREYDANYCGISMHSFLFISDGDVSYQ